VDTTITADRIASDVNVMLTSDESVESPIPVDTKTTCLSSTWTGHFVGSWM
jgi:hypothetical protein